MKRKKRDSIQERLETARENDEDPDIDFDEVSEVYDFVLEKTKRSAEACQEEIRKSTETLGNVRLPEKGPTEKLG